MPVAFNWSSWFGILRKSSSASVIFELEQWRSPQSSTGLEYSGEERKYVLDNCLSENDLTADVICRCSDDGGRLTYCRSSKVCVVFCHEVPSRCVRQKSCGIFVYDNGG